MENGQICRSFDQLSACNFYLWQYCDRKCLCEVFIKMVIFLLFFFFFFFPEPPYFLLEPHSTHVVKRRFTILPCHAASLGGEETHIQWFHGNTPLEAMGTRHLVLQNGSLLLANVYPSQAGKYSCQASNEYGLSRVTTMVTVSSKFISSVVHM